MKPCYIAVTIYQDEPVQTSSVVKTNSLNKFTSVVSKKGVSAKEEAIVSRTKGPTGSTRYQSRKGR